MANSALHQNEMRPNVLGSILTLRDAGVLTPEQAITKASEVDPGFASLISSPVSMKIEEVRRG